MPAWPVGWLSILFHNTQLLALIVIKIWENWSSALEEVQTVIDSRSKHEFLAKKGLGRVGRSTFFLGADQRLSGEGVFNSIYYCPLGFRASCTCIPLCMRLGILMFWLRASIFSVVNRETNFLSNGAPLAHASRFVAWQKIQRHLWSLVTFEKILAGERNSSH